ncbi:MAG: SDR family NAD(P)-dependent oxidoreductase [Bacteroidetes bacterium]|nr:SDR family NAD(P)-dependent oxidoreductase [Bacteroidota bacterium]
MKLSGNTILITGGGTGIGLALAELFLKEGNEVLICGRREEMLLEAKKKNPKLHVKVCDVSNENGRKSLLQWIEAEFKNLNILVNNAGIQREIDFTKGPADIEKSVNEIKINFESPVVLSALFTPLLSGKENSAIINISSGLAFIPITIMPVYCATKAALHSYSISLRHQLQKTCIKVFEAIPPTVDTDLDQGARRARGQTDFGISAAETAIEILNGLEKDEFEILIGGAKFLMNSSKTDFENTFLLMNNR